MADDLTFDSPAVETGQRQATNLSAPVPRCLTCLGDRFVLVGTRPAVTTIWMRERGIEANGAMDEYAPCPECNPVEIEHRRFDGTLFRTLDPGVTRQRLHA